MTRLRTERWKLREKSSKISKALDPKDIRLRYSLKFIWLIVDSQEGYVYFTGTLYYG